MRDENDSICISPAIASCCDRLDLLPSKNAITFLPFFLYCCNATLLIIDALYRRRWESTSSFLHVHGWSMMRFVNETIRRIAQYIHLYYYHDGFTCITRFWNISSAYSYSCAHKYNKDLHFLPSYLSSSFCLFSWRERTKNKINSWRGSLRDKMFPTADINLSPSH